MENKNYQTDKIFLQEHLKIVELQQGDQKLLLSPDLQGRVMTSTATGDNGYSFGWINYDLIASGKYLPHCNNWGGEDRFWLGPEGGQFSLFFRRGTTFAFEEWQTPAIIDTEAWPLTAQTPTSAVLSQRAALTNCQGTELYCRLERTVTLDPVPDNLPQGVQCVRFHTKNQLTNDGNFNWTRMTGMPSIWILGQFIPSEHNTIVIPYKAHETACINDRYFGKIGDDRLKDTGKALLFKADGKKRGKIGIPPEMVLPVAGAYDAENETLTVVQYNVYPTPLPYVNSMWEYQKNPFSGDVMNAYNDGPLEDGSIMGPFYELESSSPAASLHPGESLVHIHSTSHYTGDREGLNQIALAHFGLSLEDIILEQPPK